MKSIRPAYVFLAILMGTVVASGAEAQRPKVVVLSFGGAGGPAARTQVVRALKGRADFATRSEADRVISARGLKVTGESGRRELSQALGVDYLFWGRVKGKGGSARTEIRVSGHSGDTLTGYEAGAPGKGKGNEQIQQAARTALAEAIELSPPSRQRSGAVAAGAGAASGAAASATAGKGAGSTSPSTPPEASRKDEKAERKASDKGKPKNDRASKLPVFEILVGGGIRFRNIDFVVGDGSGGTEPRTFDSGPYADVGGSFVVRPLGRSSTRALQGILIQGDGGVGFGLKTQRSGTGITNTIKTWRALGQVGYLYPIKKLQVGGLVGAGVDTFDIDLNSVLPSIQYIYFRVGAALAYTIVEDFLSFRVDGGFRKPFSLGDIDGAFGNNSSAIGWDATATVGGRLEMGFSYAVRFIYEQYKLDFAGATNNVPSMGGPGGSGEDRAMTLHFLVGWTI